MMFENSRTGSQYMPEINASLRYLVPALRPVQLVGEISNQAFMRTWRGVVKFVPVSLNIVRGCGL